jgi:hypothetical protein
LRHHRATRKLEHQHHKKGVREELRVSIDIAAMAKIAGVGVAGLAAAVIVAPGAFADPQVPGPPPGPDATVQASAPPPLQGSTPPDGVPHLTSPDNLPPDTSAEPVGPQSGPGTSYARDIWNSMQTQDISWRQGLLLLIAQRPMNPNAAPPPGMSSSPQPQGPQQPAPDAPAPPPAPGAVPLTP